ncbi:MAG: HAMP domain-containing histidine kinase [Candidatus Daviesbacteria bacterium]|nr:HAMP domain-containing histidine kinase [Candidatus Daviesbacteria bacterium]
MISREWIERFWFRFKFYLTKFAYLQKRGRLKRYLLPVVLVAVIFPLVIILPKASFQLIHSQAVSLIVFIVIVTASSWYGGLGPGIFATVLTAAVNYQTLLKQDLPFHSQTGDLLITFIYMILGLFIGIISEARYEADYRKDEFIALVAHELKNPLSAIKGFAGLLYLEFKKRGKNKFYRYVEEVDFQSDKLLELINDLLDATRVEVGKFVYKDELFDFDRLVVKVVNNQKIINSDRKIILSGYSRRIVKGDKYRLGQVITNLLTNAIKYSPDKSPIRVKMAGSKNKVILSVKDYGIGIPYIERKAIFNRFYRSGRSQRSFEGLGLGLFISSKIIKDHGGKLWAKSNGVKGSIFYMELLKA